MLKSALCAVPYVSPPPSPTTIAWIPLYLYFLSLVHSFPRSSLSVPVSYRICTNTSRAYLIPTLPTRRCILLHYPSASLSNRAHRCHLLSSFLYLPTISPIRASLHRTLHSRSRFSFFLLFLFVSFTLLRIPRDTPSTHCPRHPL
ncbi:hypothetical protein PENSPDRAFT_262070 [Peniophora sp. CONT]|nr:hypothetical protein PENSPDRAFT_262070 [Peniophora sp. CONT]